jgi:hypothetical protein
MGNVLKRFEEKIEAHILCPLTSFPEVVPFMVKWKILYSLRGQG